MIDLPSATSLIRSFLDPSDGEATKSRDLILMLLACSPDPFSRRQFTPGHITCTGLVVSPDSSRVLLVHHRRLDRWLLPGGHVEPEDATLANASRREVLEETGAVLQPDSAPPLVGLDVHGIPAKGQEPYHLHHDLLFAWCAAAEDLLASEESQAVIWCAPGQFDQYGVPGNVRRAWLRLAGV